VDRTPGFVREAGQRGTATALLEGLQLPSEERALNALALSSRAGIRCVWPLPCRTSVSEWMPLGSRRTTARAIESSPAGADGRRDPDAMARAPTWDLGPLHAEPRSATRAGAWRTTSPPRRPQVARLTRRRRAALSCRRPAAGTGSATQPGSR
jgi:hypothetical protein